MIYEGIPREAVKIVSPETSMTCPQKAKDISKLLPKFGCNAEAVRQVLGIVIGEEIPKSEVTLPPALSGVVFLKCENSHDYGIGNVCIVLPTPGEAFPRCMRKTGGIGNHPPFQDSQAWRFATKEEVDAAFAS